MKNTTITYIEWLQTKVGEDSTTGDLAKDIDFIDINCRSQLVELIRSEGAGKIPRDYVRRALHDSYMQFQQETDPIIQILNVGNIGIAGLTKSGRVIRLRYSDELKEYVPELNSFH